jgi:predicted AAA+ superfamily ATPase
VPPSKASANRLADALEPFKAAIDTAGVDYCREGGFPEVWQLADPVRKIEYLMEQQVRKVLYEDLMMVTKYRKPENVLRFFVYLLAHPGQEINMTKVASDAGVERRVIEENLPRLEMTDLILRIQKFSHQPLRVRQGNIKCYPADMALRNAVLKSWQAMDETTMGLSAENLMVRELIGWPEKIEVWYFREKNREIDFVVTFGGNRYLPIEVKYSQGDEDYGALTVFRSRYNADLGVVITRQQTARYEDGLLFLPLRFFLLVS